MGIKDIENGYYITTQTEDNLIRYVRYIKKINLFGLVDNILDATRFDTSEEANSALSNQPDRYKYLIQNTEQLYDAFLETELMKNPIFVKYHERFNDQALIFVHKGFKLPQFFFKNSFHTFNIEWFNIYSVSKSLISSKC